MSTFADVGSFIESKTSVVQTSNVGFTSEVSDYLVVHTGPGPFTFMFIHPFGWDAKAYVKKLMILFGNVVVSKAVSFMLPWEVFLSSRNSVLQHQHYHSSAHLVFCFSFVLVFVLTLTLIRRVPFPRNTFFPFVSAD